MAGGREPMKPDLRADESEETEGKGLECLRKARGREQRAAAQALQNHEWRAERSVILLEDVGPRHAVAHGIQALDRPRRQGICSGVRGFRSLTSPSTTQA